MSPSVLSVFTSGYLTRKQVDLGRLVLDIKNPGQNFCPHSPLKLTKNDVAKNDFKHVHEILHYDQSSQFRATLTKFLSVFMQNNKASFDDIETQLASTYQLLNSDAWFENLCKDENIKRWLERFLKRGTVSMVVGLHTLKHASVSAKREKTSEIGGTFQPPIAEAASGGLAASPGVAKALEVSGEGSHQERIETMSSFLAPDERIIAVQYRKIDFGIFSSKNVDNAFLEKGNRWKLYGVTRGDGELDGVKAELLETTSCKDFKVSFGPVYETVDKEETFAFAELPDLLN